MSLGEKIVSSEYIGKRKSYELILSKGTRKTIVRLTRFNESKDYDTTTVGNCQCFLTGMRPIRARKAARLARCRLGPL